MYTVDCRTHHLTTDNPDRTEMPWGENILHNGGKYSVTIPEGLADGEYILRHEVILLSFLHITIAHPVTTMPSGPCSSHSWHTERRSILPQLRPGQNFRRRDYGPSRRHPNAWLI
jgi:hypothetical protein